MNVLADQAQIGGIAWADDESFITSAKEMSAEAMTRVEADGVGAEEPFHGRNEIGLRCFEGEVKMVWHEAEGMQQPAGFGAGFIESVEKELAILVAAKDWLSAITAVHEVITRAGEFNP